MIARQPKRFTVNEYLAIEDAREGKQEYFMGEILDMSGGSYNHAVIAGNTLDTLKRHLKGSGCTVVPSDMRVKTPSLTYAYPDVSVVCGKPVIVTERGTESLTNPRLLVEVLSPTTAGYDIGDKFYEYRSIPEFDTYILIAQDKPQVELRQRTNAGKWESLWLEDLDEALEIANLGIRIPLVDLYVDVNWSEKSR
jgi:Uma2 family endonuclease